MENLSPIEKLDYVLNVLKDQTVFLTRNQILNVLRQSGFTIAHHDLVRIMDRLINDGYVIEMKTDESGQQVMSSCQISYYGYLFKGYKAKERTARWHKLALDIRVWSLAVGTAMAGIYGLFEIVKWFFHHEGWHVYF